MYNTEDNVDIESCVVFDYRSGDTLGPHKRSGKIVVVIRAD